MLFMAQSTWMYNQFQPVMAFNPAITEPSSPGSTRFSGEKSSHGASAIHIVLSCVEPELGVEPMQCKRKTTKLI